MTNSLQLGLALQIAIIAAGVGAVLAASATAFYAIKWFGVAYLVYLAVKQWRAQAQEVLGLPNDAAGPTYNLMFPHSCCPHCSQPIRPWENIPVLSYLVLRGRCAHCRGPISARYPLTELACALISAVVAWHFGVGWQGAAIMLLSWGLLAMSLIDADHW